MYNFNDCSHMKIIYMHCNHICALQKINTVALDRKEKSTLLMNENNRIDDPQIKIVKCVGPKAQDKKKCVETVQKQTIDVIFKKQNSQLLTLSFPTQEIIQVNGQNRTVANFPVVDFSSQPR